MASFRDLPSIDLTALDLRNIDLSKLDLSKLDLSRLDLPKVDLPKVDDRLVDAVRDAAYIAIGFGVLGVQQAQVRRRELQSRLSQAQQAAGTVCQQVSGFVRQAV
jgi:uncharacterized protein YjbI with pentapeptide repeats